MSSCGRLTFDRSGWLTVAIVIAALVVGFVLGAALSRRTAPEPRPAAEEVQAQFWTCSMHPQIRQPEAGLCPICGMELIPVYESGGGGDGGRRTLTLSESARKLAEIQVAPARRKAVEVELRMVGKVEVDETRLGYITARMAGRIDRLWVNYTGVRVKKGDPMVGLYSPELLSAQEELLQATRAASRSTAEAVRNRLRLWGLTEDQIDEILDRGKAAEQITLRAPMSGTVLERHATVGMYVDTGMRIYTIADLSNVWVKLDAYESDLIWIRDHQAVEFETEAYPGERFAGRVAFVDPVVDPRSRTVKVRVEVSNPEGRLKPEMFVRARVRASVPPEKGQLPLTIPATAPLVTGKRAVVYVELPGRDGAYEGREVVLGPRAGDDYVVREGLSEGERVVVHGAFKIDSAIQILAKPSMMNPEGGVPMTGHEHHGSGSAGAPMSRDRSQPHDVPPAFRAQLGPVYSAYFGIQRALSHDSLEPAREGAGSLIRALGASDMRLVEGAAHDDWMRELGRSRNSAEAIRSASDLEDARRAFDPLSQSLIRVATLFRPASGTPIIVYDCSMAFEGRGARWLQDTHGVENPYFGSAMFRCGEELETVVPGATTAPVEHVH